MRASLPRFCSLPSSPAPCSIIFTTTCEIVGRVRMLARAKGAGPAPCLGAYLKQEAEQAAGQRKASLGVLQVCAHCSP